MHMYICIIQHGRELGSAEGACKHLEAWRPVRGAELALTDPLALTCEDPDGEDEQRFVTVGADAVGRIVTVVHSYRDAEVRLISARRATRKERDSYARGI